MSVCACPSSVRPRDGVADVGLGGGTGGGADVGTAVGIEGGVIGAGVGVIGVGVGLGSPAGEDELAAWVLPAPVVASIDSNTRTLSNSLRFSVLN